MAVWTLFFSTILLPLFSIVLLWLRPRRPAGAWYVTMAMAVALTAFSFLVAPWGWFGMGVRYALIVLFVIALVASLRRPPYEEARTEGSPLRMIVKVLIAVMFGSVALGALRARSVPPGPVDMAFPLRNGTFLVQHGGSESAANIHAHEKAQRFALDVVALNAAGMRAQGLYPGDLAKYEIFGAEVVSPCGGVVTAAKDGLPDQTPGTVDEKSKEGNHVVLRCGDVAVTLAHLRRGSVRVHVNESIATGALVGNVGNSGNTTEPHLHVHGERAGVAVPLRFDGRWLVRNSVVPR